MEMIANRASHRMGWSDAEEKLLWETAEDAQSRGLPLKAVFEHIAERTGVHVQISHLKIMQKINWHLADEELALIDGANARGLRITCDQYPYTASALALSAFLPHWAHDGGMEAMMERVHHPTAQMLAEMDVKLEGRGGPKGIVICSTRGIREDWEGMTIEAIADSLGLDHLQAVLDYFNSPSVGLCFDAGHANIWAKETVSL